MTTPKNPEEIMRGLQEMLTPEARIVSDPNGGAFSAIHYDTPPLTNESLQDFLRSSMASLLLGMAERMKPEPRELLLFEESRINTFEKGYNTAFNVARTLLTNEARKITDNG